MTRQELFSSFLQHLYEMEEKLQHVQELQAKVNLETEYREKVKIYDSINVTMDEFDNQRTSVMKIYEELQTILNAKEMIEINTLMTQINLC
jgi:Zn-dependent oligopeptidase